jgi:hypothetical protein
MPAIGFMATAAPVNCGGGDLVADGAGTTDEAGGAGGADEAGGAGLGVETGGAGTGVDGLGGTGV